MTLPPFVLACAPTLTLLTRAVVSRELPLTCYDDAWNALDDPEAYKPTAEVEEWMRANWRKLLASGELRECNAGVKPEGETTPDYPVSPALARRWMQPFLDRFVETGGNATAAAAHAGVHERTPYKAREGDGVFAEAWEWAEHKIADAIRAEIYRRAVEGWEEPQFGRLQGEMAGDGEIGAVRKFDSSLLIKMATARVPEYRTLVKEGAAQVSASASASASSTTSVTITPERAADLQARKKRQLEKQAEREARIRVGGNN